MSQKITKTRKKEPSGDTYIGHLSLRLSVSHYFIITYNLTSVINQELKFTSERSYKYIV